VPNKFYLTENKHTFETNIESIIRFVEKNGSGKVFTMEYDDGDICCTKFYFSCDVHMKRAKEN